MDSLTAARLQMTVSLAFHMVYAAIGIGIKPTYEVESEDNLDREEKKEYI